MPFQLKLFRCSYILILSITYAIVLPPAFAGERLQPEKVYQGEWCGVYADLIYKGVAPKTLADGTHPDCVSLGYAIEVDFADKAWKEGIGQAANYAIELQLRPGVLMIVESEKDCADVMRTHKVAGRTSVDGNSIKVWETGPWANKCKLHF